MNNNLSIKKEEYTATKNACKLCTPLGASLVFKGIKGAVPLLHGSQGCSTYIRRYLISHFKEPMDIACSNFAEETAIFGGGANLKIALENIRKQYDPELVGIATTCLSETIGDDVPMFIREYKEMCEGQDLPPIVHISTPSYQGTHMQGFHGAVRALVEGLAENGHKEKANHVNLFPGMVSPADLRHFKEIMTDFGIPFMLLPDYSQTLDGPLWTEYQRVPPGGTHVSSIKAAGNALASFEFGVILGAEKDSAGRLLQKKFAVPCHTMGLPIGVEATDQFFNTLADVSGKRIPEKYQEERGRLLDSYVDAHKYVMDARAVVYGEEDLVVAIAGFLNEIGVIPVFCASGGKSGHLTEKIAEIIPEYERKEIQVFDNADFTDIEHIAKELKPDFIIGHSKGYAMSRRLGIPLIRIGFPVHDRINGSRIHHIAYRGTQELFDRIANTIIEIRQNSSSVGYTYM